MRRTLTIRLTGRTFPSQIATVLYFSSISFATVRVSYYRSRVTDFTPDSGALPNAAHIAIYSYLQYSHVSDIFRA